MKTFEVEVDGDEVVAVRVDGARYESAGDVEDPSDRQWVTAFLLTWPHPEVAIPSVRPFPVEKIVAGVFFLVSLITLSVAVLTGLHAWNASDDEVSAAGRVVDLVTRKDSEGNEFFYPRVEYSLSDGTPKLVQLREGSWPAAYEKGDAVTILYDRNDPSRARIDSTSGSVERWIWTIITGVIGLAFTVATVFAVSMGRSAATPEERFG